MSPLPLLAAVALLLCAVGTFLFHRRASALLSSIDSISKKQGSGAEAEKLVVEHDVVVIGAGCSACALVSTLVQGGKRVLLLEGGGQDVYRQASAPLGWTALRSCHHTLPARTGFTPRDLFTRGLNELVAVGRCLRCSSRTICPIRAIPWCGPLEIKSVTLHPEP